MGSKGVLPNSTLKLTQTDLAVRSLRVAIGGTPVGTLAQTAEGPIAFEYDASWLARGFALSPFSLPLEGGLRVAKLHPFDGLFGVFDDSLPDGWGRLLVDRLWGIAAGSSRHCWLQRNGRLGLRAGASFDDIAGAAHSR